MTERLSEAASEKPKRGRPRVTHEHEDRAFAMSPWMAGKTRRRQVGQAYWGDAFDVLTEDTSEGARDIPEALSWLRGQVAVMAELGRIDEPATLRKCAELLCRWKPTSKEAIAWIRRVRGASKARPAGDLLRTLRKSLDKYERLHPDLTRTEVVAALNSLAREVEVERCREEADAS